MALGAQRAHVWRLVLGEGMAATLAGIVIGLAGAAAATRVIETMLFGVTRWNPLAFAAGPVVLALGAPERLVSGCGRGPTLWHRAPG